MSRWVRCSYGKRAGFVDAKIVHFLESTNNSEDFFVVMLLSMQSYGKMREKANFICTFPNASNFSEGKVTEKC